MSILLGEEGELGQCQKGEVGVQGIHFLLPAVQAEYLSTERTRAEGLQSIMLSAAGCWFIGAVIRHCAADFSLLNLPKGKSLGRSKPATNS